MSQNVCCVSDTEDSHLYKEISRVRVEVERHMFLYGGRTSGVWRHHFSFYVCS